MITGQIKKLNREVVRNDRLRKKLIESNKIDLLIKTYTRKYDVKNLNSGRYWDIVFKNEQGIESQSPMTRDKINKIAKLISPGPISVLDLGIGQGFLEEVLIQKKTSHRLYGIDISKHSIKRAKKLFKGEFIVGNVLDISKFYPKNFADIIVALELVEHISPSLLFSFYKKVHKTLKKDGKFMLSIPINEGLEKMISNPSAHVRDYSYPIIKTELELNGFHVDKTFYLFAFSKNYIFKKLVSKIFFRKWKPNSLIILASKVN